jgi:hypothetical protein
MSRPPEGHGKGGRMVVRRRSAPNGARLRRDWAGAAARAATHQRIAKISVARAASNSRLRPRPIQAGNLPCWRRGWPVRRPLHWPPNLSRRQLRYRRRSSRGRCRGPQALIPPRCWLCSVSPVRAPAILAVGFGNNPVAAQLLQQLKTCCGWRHTQPPPRRLPEQQMQPPPAGIPPIPVHCCRRRSHATGLRTSRIQNGTASRRPPAPGPRRSWGVAASAGCAATLHGSICCGPNAARLAHSPLARWAMPWRQLAARPG